MSFVFVRKADKRKRRAKRGKSNTYAKVEGRSAEKEGQVFIHLAQGIKKFKNDISIEQLYHAWRSGNLDQVMELIPWDKLPKELAGAVRDLGKHATDVTKIAKDAMPAPVRNDLRLDLKNPKVEQLIRERVGNLVVGINEDTRQSIQDAVTRSIQNGWSPKDVARQIQGSIGLDPRRQKALENYRQGLRLEGMPETQIDKLTAQYENRLLESRAMTIARQETRWAANESQLEVWKAAAKQGLIDQGTTKKVWFVDGNPCEVCEPMDGVAVDLDEDWDLPNGDSVDNPSDSHPNCCCGMELEFTYEQAEDDAEEENGEG